MVSVYVGGSRDKLIDELRRVLLEVEAQPEGDGLTRATIEGEMNDSRRGAAEVIFSNDDMERPEVADRIIVDVEND